MAQSPGSSTDPHHSGLRGARLRWVPRLDHRSPAPSQPLCPGRTRRLPGQCCGELRSPLVSLKPGRKELGSPLGLTRRRQMATFSKQHSMFQTPGCAGQAGASAVRSQPDPPESLAPLSPGRVWSRKGPKTSLRAGQPPEAVGGAAKGRGGDSSGVCLKSTVWCVFRAIWR